MTNKTIPSLNTQAVDIKNDKYYFSMPWGAFFYRIFDKIYKPSYDIIDASTNPVTVTIDNNMYVIDTTSGAITANLPTAVGLKGRYKTFVNSGTNNLTLDGFGAETINGSGTYVVASGAFTTIMSNGINWLRIG